MPEQRSLDIAYMLMAKTWGERLSKDQTHKIGCLVVKNGKIISDGYNGTLAGFDNNCEDESGHTVAEVVHAESNAITKLATSTESSEGATLYTKMSPCFDCAKLIIHAKIKRVVFLERYMKTGKTQCGIHLLHCARPNVEVHHLMLDQQALSLHSQLVTQAFV